MANGSVRIMCPNLTCRKILAVPEIARCKNCGTCIRIPDKPKAGPGTKPEKSPT